LPGDGQHGIVSAFATMFVTLPRYEKLETTDNIAVGSCH